MFVSARLRRFCLSFRRAVERERPWTAASRRLTQNPSWNPYPSGAGCLAAGCATLSRPTALAVSRPEIFRSIPSGRKSHRLDDKVEEVFMSFQQISIRNFRAIASLEIENIKQINLLTGRNNCGKTSVLEAISLLDLFPLITLWYL